MSAAYQYVLSRDAVQLLLVCHAKDRKALERLCESLAAAPNQPGDFVEYDSTRRSLQVKRFGHWLVTYWPDHPVKELRIVRIEPA